MTRLTVRQWMGYGLVCAILIGMGCKGGNIFGLRDPSDGNAGDLVAKGQKLLRDGKPNEALAVFDRALKADSLSSEVRFYHAKATLQASGFSIVDLLRDVTSNFTTPGEGVPLHTRDTSLSQAEDELKKTRLYRAAYTISKDLTPIRKGLTHGSFDSSSVALDLAIANLSTLSCYCGIPTRISRLNRHRICFLILTSSMEWVVLDTVSTIWTTPLTAVRTMPRVSMISSNFLRRATVAKRA